MGRRKHKRGRIAALAGVVAGLGLLTWLRLRTDRRTIQRRFWQPLYDRFAGLYDAVDWLTAGTTHRLRRRVLRHLPPPGSRVLEIGCGSGRLHRELAGQYDLAGIDLAPGMIRLAGRRLAAAERRSHLAVASASALPWRSDAFDAVVSTFVLSALPDADAAIDEMVRVARPGRQIVIVDAGEPYHGHPIARGFAWLWAFIGDYIRDEVPLMWERGLSVRREDYGPWGSVHVVCGTLPDDREPAPNQIPT